MGKEISPDFSDQFPRQKYISLLFNKEDERIKENSPQFSNEYVELKKQFIQEFCSQKIKLDKLSENIFAVSTCLLKYKGKEKEAQIVLSKERGKNYSKWVVCNISIDFLKIKRNEATKNALLPNSHETDFTSLKKALDSKTNYQGLIKKDVYNQLSVFLYLASIGDIEFNYVKKTDYVILAENKWVISVSEFKRDTPNSGWLISNLTRQNEKSPFILHEFFSTFDSD